MAALKITYKDPAQLRPRARNPRTHTAKQSKQLVASIKEFGFISPILIDGSDGIIAGHGRAEAAKLIGMSDVPTVRVDHLTPGSDPRICYCRQSHRRECRMGSRTLNARTPRAFG